MRIWDINPGYLNDKSLLGEHRELHGIVSILVNKKNGYARHPETLRWQGFGWALARRHALLRAEMHLRSFHDRTPVELAQPTGRWPDTFIDTPAVQFDLLAGKYEQKRHGRIPLPTNVQEFWAHHKYSILARDQRMYTALGRLVAADISRATFERITMTVTHLLRVQPSEGMLRNALQHMWGYVADLGSSGISRSESKNPGTLLVTIQELVKKHDITYLLRSTALSELGAWL
jgi:hypothetical protein